MCARSIIDGPSREGHPIFRAATQGDAKLVAALLADEPYLVNARSSAKLHRPVLSRAVEEGKEVVVKLLLEKGASVNEADDEGWTPLTLACDRGHDAIVAMLLAKGADPNIRTKRSGWGSNALHLAADRGHHFIVLELLAHAQQHVGGQAPTGHRAVDINAADQLGRTALWRACWRGHVRVS